jgi:hypothetical protein
MIRGDASVTNDLRIRILDYFIIHDFSDDIFEDVLKGRLDDPDPAKESSKVICAEILEAWRNRYNDKP